MWISWKLLFCLSGFITTAAASVVQVFAYIGGEANVSCSYPQGYESHEKYLCSENCQDSDVLVTTTQGRRNRYSIHDDRQRHIFTVTVSNVEASDAGTYWCGVTKTGRDIYTEVKVHIKTNECCGGVSTSIQAYESGSISMNCTYSSGHIDSFKYVCRGFDLSSCRQQALVTTNMRQHGRFKLKETQNEFTVDLTNVTKQDAGPYLCGVHRDNDFDVFSRIELTVTDWCCVNSHEVEGFLGQSVTLPCPYPADHRSNTKFLCKGEHRNTCETVVTSEGHFDRFRLQDEGSSFSVTVTGLREDDAGTYWCGSDRHWTPGKSYTKVQLSFEYSKSGVPPKKTTNTKGSELNKGSDGVTSHIVLYVLPALLVILVVVTAVIVYRYSCLRPQGERDLGRAKGDIDVSMYCNQEAVKAARVKAYPNGEDWHMRNEDLYENVRDENIYNNC